MAEMEGGDFCGGGWGDDPTNDPGQLGDTGAPSANGYEFAQGPRGERSTKDLGSGNDEGFASKFTEAISGDESVGSSFYGA